MKNDAVAAADGAVRLSQVTEGTRVRLSAVECPRHLASHLLAMGLRPRVEFTVHKADRTGPVIIAMGTMRLALGRGVARRIMVVRLPAIEPGAGNADKD